MLPRRVVRALLLSVVVCGLVAAAPDARAASQALIIDLVDVEPIGLRVFAAESAQLCSLVPDQWLVSTTLSKGKLVVVNSDAIGFCVAQTYAPFTTVTFQRPIFHRHWPGTPPIHIHLRSKPEPLLQAKPTTPFVVTLDGNETIGLRVAVADNMWCDAPENTTLYSGILEPKKPVSIATAASCVCYWRTSAPFTTVGWSTPRLACRRRACKHCPVDTTSPFTVSLPSKVP